MFEYRKEREIMETLVGSNVAHVLYHRVCISRALVVCHLITWMELIVMETGRRLCPESHECYILSLLLFQLQIYKVNPLNPELNPICYLLALLAHHFLHVSRIKVKSLTLRLLMSYIYIYGTPILDVSRSHTTTQHSR